MPEWLQYVLILLAVGVVVSWCLIIALVILIKPKGVSLLQGLRLIPDVIRLLRRLASERGVASTMKLALVGVFVYLVSPVDIIPDVIPVIGTVDDVILFIWVLRSFIAKVGPEMVRRNWPGNRESADLLHRLLLLPEKRNGPGPPTVLR